MTTVSVTDLTNAKTDVDHIAAIATSTALTATDRLGTTKKTLHGAINSISAITDRGAWTTATAYAVKDVVLDTGVYYICITAHTSGGTFAGDSAKWRVYQGDLGAYHSVDVVNDIRSNDFSNRKMIRIATERGNPVYYLDSADTTSVDDDFLVIVDSAGNRFKLAHNGTIDVRWAGAFVNGSDDSVYVQKILNAKKIAYIPPATTLTISHIDLSGGDCGIVGSGYLSKINAFNLTSNCIYAAGSMGSEVQGLVIGDFRLIGMDDGSGTKSGDLVNLAYIKDSTFRPMWIENAADRSFSIGSSFNFNIPYIFSRSNNVGWTLASTSDGDGDAVVISKCHDFTFGTIRVDNSGRHSVNLFGSFDFTGDQIQVNNSNRDGLVYSGGTVGSGFTGGNSIITSVLINGTAAEGCVFENSLNGVSIGTLAVLDAKDAGVLISDGLDGDGVQNIQIGSLTIDGVTLGPDALNYGLYIFKSTGVQIGRVSIRGTGSNAVRVNGVHVSTNESDISIDSMNIDAGLLNIISADGVKISQGTIKNSPQQAVILDSSDNCDISSTSIINANTSATVSAHPVHIKNSSSSNKLTNLRVGAFTPSGSSSEDAIHIDAGCTGNDIAILKAVDSSRNVVRDEDGDNTVLFSNTAVRDAGTIASNITHSFDQGSTLIIRGMTGANRNVTPSGLFSNSFFLTIINSDPTFSAIFDPSGLNHTVVAGDSKRFMYYSGGWYLSA